MNRKALARVGVVSLGLVLAVAGSSGAATGLLGSQQATTANAATLGQSQASWSSGFQVQNLESQVANVKVIYFNREGVRVKEQTTQIQPFSSFTFFGATMEVDEGFFGSVVIESDRQIAAITNELASNPTLLDSYAGSTNPSNVINLPLVMRNNGGYSTELFIQNAGQADATDLKIEFFRPGQATPVLTKTKTDGPLKPGASWNVNQATETGLGDRFVGSAKITAGQTLAAVVNQSNGTVLLSYNGVASGGPSVFAPLVQAQNSGWETGMQVQNIGSSAQTVRLTVRDGGGNSVRTEEATIPANGSQTWFPIFTGGRLVGSATIEATGGTGGNLVGIVNQVNLNTGQGTTYTGFNAGTNQVFVPLLMTNNSGFYTGLQAQNVGTAAANVTLIVSNSSGQEVGRESIQLAAGSSKTWFPVPGTSDGFVGSARITSDTAGAKVVAIVNTITSPQKDGDTSSSYVAINAGQ
ncbi:MAG: hypothetical protein HY329_20105 [Chloroflexi bacterium]|nr:hypothetical protein [Chloroflexota bacterium]